MKFRHSFLGCIERTARTQTDQTTRRYKGESGPKWWEIVRVVVHVSAPGLIPIRPDTATLLHNEM